MEECLAGFLVSPHFHATESSELKLGKHYTNEGCSVDEEVKYENIQFSC